MLKTTTYSGDGGNGQVKYLVVDKKRVYFSSLTRSPSSVWSAEAIMVAIANAENIDWRQYAFIDIQTHLSSRHFKLGEFGVDGLVFEPEGTLPQITGWTRVSCPGEVLNEFAELIGISHVAVNTKAYEGRTWTQAAIEIFQRHHDMYVRLHRRHNGELSFEDMGEYNLAMQREHDGFLQPLPEEDEKSSMEVRIPEANWALSLAHAIRTAEPGSIIIVSTDAKKEAGERARERLGRDDLAIRVEVPTE